MYAFKEEELNQRYFRVNLNFYVPNEPLVNFYFKVNDRTHLELIGLLKNFFKRINSLEYFEMELTDLEKENRIQFLYFVDTYKRND